MIEMLIFLKFTFVSADLISQLFGVIEKTEEGASKRRSTFVQPKVERWGRIGSAKKQQSLAYHVNDLNGLKYNIPSLADMTKKSS